MSALRLIRSGTVTDGSQHHDVQDVFSDKFDAYEIHTIWSGSNNGDADMKFLSEDGQWVHYVRGSKIIAYTHTTDADSANPSTRQIESGLTSSVKGAARIIVLNPYSKTTDTVVHKSVMSYSSTTVAATRDGNSVVYEPARITGFAFAGEYSALNNINYYVYGLA
jgi:hypothetical protein